MEAGEDGGREEEPYLHFSLLCLDVLQIPAVFCSIDTLWTPFGASFA